MNQVAGVRNLRLKYPGDKSLLLKDVSLAIDQGEKVLFLGPSGCGKSTLLQVLSGLIPESIEVPLKADEIIVPSSWGYIFQDPDSQFCMPFVDEEIAFVLENLQVPNCEMKSHIQSLLEMVDIKLANIHTSISMLSGGMKQRLAIASALALNPDVLFLDEPTAMLDPVGTKDIWQTIKKIAHEKTLIIVEHKLDHVIDLVDRIILFGAHGEIIGDGNKTVILEKFKAEMIQNGIWYPGIWEEYHAGNRQDLFVPSGNPIISLHDFCGYQQKEVRLYIEDLDIAACEWIAITGENGAGKTTLLYSLMNLIKTSGTCAIEHARDTIAFVFQNPEFQFLTNSVIDEVTYSLKLVGLNGKEMNRLVEEILKRLQLNGKETAHPYQLSWGQKRRLSVATALVNKPRLLLTDEPTFGQDAKNTFAILEMLEEYRKNGMTIVMVTHDTEVVRQFATRVLTISKGNVVSDVRNDHNTAEHQQIVI